MSKPERVDRAARRKQAAETRLARSRPAREAVAAAHAGHVSGRVRRVAAELGQTAPDLHRTAELSALERKVLEGADDILVSKGEDGQRLAELVRDFVRSQ